jgi:hypothetical protein
MAEGSSLSTDDWDRDDEWRSPARASPSTTGRRRADGLEALSSSEDGDDDFDDERSTGRESAFHTPAAHLLNATSTTTSSRCNTGKSSALGRDADEWMREARERIADLEISSSPIDPSNDDRSVSISPGGLPATPTRTSPAPRVDAATKVSREVDAMILKAAARAEAAAAAAANRSARLAATGPSPDLSGGGGTRGPRRGCREGGHRAQAGGRGCSRGGGGCAHARGGGEET